MSSRDVFISIGDFMYGAPFEFYDNVGNIFNYSLIVMGFVGLFYWLNWQKKFNKQADENPNQIK